MDPPHPALPQTLPLSFLLPFFQLLGRAGGVVTPYTQAWDSS